ncbi:MAG: response regulator transcription factor [Bacteroidia bacterium]
MNRSNIEFYSQVLTKLNCTYSIVINHSDFEKLLKSEPVDLIILDLDLDNTDAISVVKEIQLEKEKKPVVVVCSQKTDDFILVSSLNSGADNFITLPVSPVIFELKVKALLKRVEKENKKTESAAFVIDREQFVVIFNKVVHHLPRLEFNLLDLLFSEPNKVFSKLEIAKTLWNDESVSGKRTIDIHIRNIRKELGNNSIKTFRGIGYSINVQK